MTSWATDVPCKHDSHYSIIISKSRQAYSYSTLQVKSKIKKIRVKEENLPETIPETTTINQCLNTIMKKAVLASFINR